MVLVVLGILTSYVLVPCVMSLVRSVRIFYCFVVFNLWNGPVFIFVLQLILQFSTPIFLSKFYLPTYAQKSCFKRILKFTLQQLLHVSVQSPSSGSVLFELAKVIVINIIC